MEEAENKLKQPSASKQRISTAHSDDTGTSCAQVERGKSFHLFMKANFGDSIAKVEQKALSRRETKRRAIRDERRTKNREEDSL